MSTMTVSEARAALPRLLDRVTAGEEITITRHGQEIAVILRPDALRARRSDRALADADRLRERLVHGRSVPLAEAPRLSAERADALAAEVAASRTLR